ncbi:MAG: hypothetical protein WDN69_17625 [Aliidongia sp.]
MHKTLLSGVLAAVATASAPLVAHANSVTISIKDLAVSAGAAPGKAVTFSANLTANENISGYPIEYSYVKAGSASGPASVQSINLSANKSTPESVKVTLPSDLAAGTYTLFLWAYRPQMQGAPLASSATSFTVGSGVATPPPTRGQRCLRLSEWRCLEYEADHRPLLVGNGFGGERQRRVLLVLELHGLEWRHDRRLRHTGAGWLEPAPDLSRWHLRANHGDPARPERRALCQAVLQLRPELLRRNDRQ